jgi:hypothetical protein
MIKERKDQPPKNQAGVQGRRPSQNFKDIDMSIPDKAVRCEWDEKKLLQKHQGVSKTDETFGSHERVKLGNEDQQS